MTVHEARMRQLSPPNKSLHPSRRNHCGFRYRRRQRTAATAGGGAPVKRQPFGASLAVREAQVRPLAFAVRTMSGGPVR